MKMLAKIVSVATHKSNGFARLGFDNAKEFASDPRRLYKRSSWSRRKKGKRRRRKCEWNGCIKPTCALWKTCIKSAHHAGQTWRIIIQINTFRRKWRQRAQQNTKRNGSIPVFVLWEIMNVGVIVGFSCFPSKSGCDRQDYYVLILNASEVHKREKNPNDSSGVILSLFGHSLSSS